MSRETTVGANCLLKRKLNKGTSSCLPSANTCLFTTAHLPWQQGAKSACKRVKSKAENYNFFSLFCFAFPPPRPLSVGYSVIMRAVTLGMFLLLPSRSSLCFLSFEFRIGSEMLIHIISNPPHNSLNSSHSSAFKRRGCCSCRSCASL